MTTGIVEIRQLSQSDSLAYLTDLLHCAYKPLLDMGLRYFANYQTEDDTRKRIRGGKCFVALLNGRVIGTATYHFPAGWAEVPWLTQPGVASHCRA